ncbi:MAG TPA: hypothetical protein VGA88_08370 [Burkholderiales bacterium]
MAKLEKISIGEFQGQRAIRLDWSNDRHHAIVIQHPDGPDTVADALRRLAIIVHDDSAQGLFAPKLSRLT